jgi:hypothetical protein
VELDLTLPNVAVAAAVLFGLPLLLAVFGALAGRRLGFTGDVQTLGAGALGLFAGFAIAALADRLLPGLRARGELKRVLGRGSDAPEVGEAPSPHAGHDG